MVVNRFGKKIDKIFTGAFFGSPKRLSGAIFAFFRPKKRKKSPPSDDGGPLG